MQNLPFKRLSLDEVVKEILIPLTNDTANYQTIIMPVANKDALPRNVTVEEYKLKGKRVIRQYNREATHVSATTAKWPEESLCEKNVPFFFFVLSGTLKLVIGKQKLICGDKKFIFVPPGVPHPDGQKPYSSDKKRSSILWMRRSGKGVRCWISHSYDGKNYRAGKGESFYVYNEQLVHLFGIICDELMVGQTSVNYQLALELFFRLIKREFQLGRMLDISNINGEQYLQAENSFINNDPMLMAEEFIQTHLAEQLTLERVARQIYMSRANFARLFRAHTGQTFLNYVHHRRLQLACIYLKEVTWSIESIAHLCGFASESGFHRFFMKYQGCTPQFYRMNHNKINVRSSDNSKK